MEQQVTDKPTVIIIRETWKESVLSDTYSYLIAIAMMAPGYFLNVDALQWLGAILFMITLLAQGSNMKYKMSVAEARDRLDEIEKDMQ